MEIPEAVIRYAKGGHRSSREQFIETLATHGGDHERRRAAYASERWGSDGYRYDFGDVVFGVSVRRGKAVLTVLRDDSGMEKAVEWDGLVLASGRDLMGRQYVSDYEPKQEKPAAAEYTVRPEPGKTSVLSVVDTYGWAWDIASRELFAALGSGYSGRVVSKADLLGGAADPAKWDVVLCYTYTAGNVLSRLDPRNTVVCVAGMENLAEKMKHAQIRRFRFFGACNEAIAGEIRRALPEASVWVLSHGVDLQAFKPAQTPHDGFVVGWAGDANRPLKRYPVAEEACRLAGAELRAAGMLGTPSHRSHAEMPEFYAGLDVFLVTSRSEAHSLVTYEAAASGLPIVTTDAGDVGDSFTDGADALILPTDCSAEDVAAKLTYLMGDADARSILGAAARRMVEAEWGWVKVAAEYRSAFREVMHVPRPGKRKVGFLWWENPYSEMLSVLQLQKTALESMGVEVELFSILPTFSDPATLKRLNDVDLVFTGVQPFLVDDRRKLVTAPILYQIDGYGESTMHDGWVNPANVRCVESADLCTFLDLNVAEEYASSGLPFDWAKMLYVPNGSTPNDAKPLDRRPGERLVVSLTKENVWKRPWLQLEAFRLLHKSHPDTRMLFPVLGWKGLLHGYEGVSWPRDVFGPPCLYEYADGTVVEPSPPRWFNRDNGDIMSCVRIRLDGAPGVDILQHLPYRLIPSYIAASDVFLHYSDGDAFAKTVSEAFGVGKAPVVSDIVRAQGVSVENLPRALEAVGKPMREAYDLSKPLLGSGWGKHLLVAPRRDPAACADRMRWCLDNPAEYAAMGAEARRFSDAWLSWADKWRAIFGLAEDRHLI